MTMADVLVVLFVHLGLMAVMIGYWLASGALLPRFAAWSERRYAERPARTALMGVLTAGPILLAGFALSNKAALPAAKPLGTSLLIAVVFLGLLGSAGLVRRIGAGLPSASDREAPWRGTLRGGVVLFLTFAMPFLGWFFLLPLTLLSGCGLVLAYAAKGRREPRELAEAPPLEEAA